jgi:hypothetical protein
MSVDTPSEASGTSSSPSNQQEEDVIPSNEELDYVHSFFSDCETTADWFTAVHTEEILGMDGAFNTFELAVLFGKYLQWMELHSEEFFLV